MKKLAIILLLLTTFLSLSAQRFYQPLGLFYDLDMQQTVTKNLTNCYSAVKPLMISDTGYAPAKSENFKSWMKRHFLEDDFLVFHNEDYSLTINPIFNFMLRREKDDPDKTNYYHNLRGIEAFGRLGKRIHFETQFYENQALFIPFEDSVMRKMMGGDIPGQGYGKAYKEDGYDWAMAMGSITVDVNRHFRVTLGNGKNFIGSGYRSLILSDLSFSYPYMRYDLNFGKFYYYVLWTDFKCGKVPSEDQHYKFGSYHVAGFKPNDKWELSIVEGVIWNNTKNGVYSYKPNAGMLLPIIFVPTFCNGFNGDSNVQLGYDVNYSPVKNIKLYTQFNYQGVTETHGCEDDISNNAFQFGVHFYDLLFDKVCDTKFHLQFEYDFSRLQNGDRELDFWNYGYPLTTMSLRRRDSASPVADCSELFVKADISYKRFMVDGSYSDFRDARYQNLTLRYFLNKTTKWNVYLSFDHHTCNSLFYGRDWDSKYISFGMQICPANFYYDF